jgi:hypothetical protein
MAPDRDGGTRNEAKSQSGWKMCKDHGIDETDASRERDSNKR